MYRVQKRVSSRKCLRPVAVGTKTAAAFWTYVQIACSRPLDLPSPRCQVWEGRTSTWARATLRGGGALATGYALAQQHDGRAPASTVSISFSRAESCRERVRGLLALVVMAPSVMARIVPHIPRSAAAHPIFPPTRDFLSLGSRISGIIREPLTVDVPAISDL